MRRPTENDDAGRGNSPASPAEYLRRILGRGPTQAEQARMDQIQATLGLAGNDAIFAIVSIFEAYLGAIQEGCRRLSRLMVKTLILAALVSVICSAFIYFNMTSGLSSAIADTVQKAFAPFEEKLDALAVCGSLKDPQLCASMDAISRDRLKGFLAAVVAAMPEEDAQRLTSSANALAIVRDLPRLTEAQIRPIVLYTNGINSTPPQPSSPARR